MIFRIAKLGIQLNSPTWVLFLLLNKSNLMTIQQHTYQCKIVFPYITCLAYHFFIYTYSHSTLFLCLSSVFFCNEQIKCILKYINKIFWEQEQEDLPLTLFKLLIECIEPDLSFLLAVWGTYKVLNQASKYPFGKILHYKTL